MADGTWMSAFGRRVDRRAVERWLEAFVVRNRFEIAVVVPLIGALILIAGAMGLLAPRYAFNPFFVLAGTLFMRLPLLAGIAPLVDRRAGLLLVGLCGYAYLIEFVGVTTGWPYGEFSYGVELGPMLAGVPLSLPLFFLPLVLNAYLLTILSFGRVVDTRWVRLVVTVVVVLGIDLILDPGAVALSFWTYESGGVYYGVPLSNYVGWILSGTIAVVVFDHAFDHRDVLDRLDEQEFMLDDLVSFVVLWGLVNLAFANWIPVLITGCLAGGVLATGRVDTGVFLPTR